MIFHSNGGEDVTNVTHEYNKFCSGDHPAFNGRNGTPMVKFDGTKNCKEMRI